jgi:enhancing lycopene biosynthesis protein 2
LVKVGVLLSGLGRGDGSDVQETVLAALYLTEADAEVIFLAPDLPLREVVDHRTDRAVDERRNALTESARLAGRAIRGIDQITPGDLDALIIPGGLGVIKNLCDFHFAGENCRVNEQVRHLVGGLVRRRKPVGALSTGAILLARILKNREGITPTLTVGNDAELAGKIQDMGGIHISTKGDEALVDEQNRLVSASASLSGTKLALMAQGVQNLVRGTLELVHKGEEHARSEG